jgi:hypothetical protein
MEVGGCIDIRLASVAVEAGGGSRGDTWECELRFLKIVILLDRMRRERVDRLKKKAMPGIEGRARNVGKFQLLVI